MSAIAEAGGLEKQLKQGKTMTNSDVNVETPQVGDEMEDGTIYAGLSPDTGEAMYVTPRDAPLTMKWKQAMDYALSLDANGHQDWRVPTKNELNLLYENRNKGKLKGTFNETGSYDAGGCYWSSTLNNVLAWYQKFGDGSQSKYNVDYYYDASLRCVR